MSPTLSKGGMMASGRHLKEGSIVDQAYCWKSDLETPQSLRPFAPL